MQWLWRPEGDVGSPRTGAADCCVLPSQGWGLRSPFWEVSPVAWDTMGVVMEVGRTSAEDSASLRVLGDRMETGWEHRTLCMERREMECFAQRAATPAPAGSSVPFHQVTVPTVPVQGGRNSNVCLPTLPHPPPPVLRKGIRLSHLPAFIQLT